MGRTERSFLGVFIYIMHDLGKIKFCIMDNIWMEKSLEDGILVLSQIYRIN